MTNHHTSSTFTERPIHIGYMRVSRPSQNEGHISLDIQKKCIRSYSREIGAKVPFIFYDIGTGVNSAFVRPGLAAAINQCAKDNAILVVMSVDRLARSLDVLDLLNGHTVSVVSVQEGAVSAEGRLMPLLEKARSYSAEISRRSTAAHRAKRASGHRSGNIDNLIAHRARGTNVNRSRARAKVDSLVSVLSKSPEFRRMTRKEQARHLNSIGVLNERSIYTLPVPWTAGSLRKPLKSALMELASMEAPERLPSEPGAL